MSPQTPLPHSAASVLPPHLPGLHEQAPAREPATAADLLTASQIDSTLLDIREQTCIAPGCSKTYTAAFRTFCPDCHQAELDRQMSRGTSQLQFAKTFPERAKLATRHMHGPALDKAREILPILRQPGRGAILILIGDRGTGKTVMATYWAGVLGFGLYTKAFDLFGSVKKTYHEDSKVREHEVLDRYRRADLLVIDEVQERKESEWENTLLTHLIDKRYDALKPTIVIANLKPEALDASLGPSIIRRVKETGGIIECTWPPYVA